MATLKDQERDRLAARLGEYRKLIGMSQQELAEKINTPQTTISAWERGVTMPNANQLPEIASALEVSFSDLCGIPDERSKDRALIDAYHRADEVTQKNIRLLLGLGGDDHVD